MFTLLHGDNVQASRSELTLLKQRAADREIREINGRNADPTLLTQALESSSLFETGTVVIIERLLTSLGRKTGQIKEFAGILIENAGRADIILWEDKEISTAVIKALGPSLEVRVFKTPPAVFKFLDTLRPGNAAYSLGLLSQTTGQDAPELIYAMLVKRVRYLIMAKEGIIPPGMQSWQSARLTSQAKLFTMEKLRDMHTNLYRHEVSLKSGTSPFTMKQLLEIVISDV